MILIAYLFKCIAVYAFSILKNMVHMVHQMVTMATKTSNCSPDCSEISKDISSEEN